MKNSTSSILIGTLLAGFAIGVFWLFQSKIIPNRAIDEKNTGIKTIVAKPVKKKILRKISYLGRLNEAQKLMDNDYFSLASAEIAQAIKQKPDFIEPYILLGEIYLRTNDVWKLDNLIAEMEKKFPSNSATLILQTRQFITAKKFGEVLETLKGQETLPPELLFYKAMLLALQNDHKGTKEVLKELKDFPVKEKEFQVTQSGIVEEKENFFISKSLNGKINDIENIYLEFEELVEWKNAHLFAEFSKALTKNNEALLGREFADVAIKEDVKYIDGWILRGYANLTSQAYGLAESDFRQAYELDPIRPETQYFLALALYEQSKLDEAALFFEKALDYDFEFSAEVRWKLLDILAKQEKHERVIELYRELLDYDTEPKRFVSAIHTAVNILKKPLVALEFSTILVEENSNDSFALNIHAWALIANKKFVEAETFLLRAEKADDQNPRTKLNLGILYEEQSKFDQAKEYYKTTYEIGQNEEEYSSVVNLAVTKYNKLLDQENPQVPVLIDVPEHSP